MILSELKSFLESNSLNKKCLIFVCTGNGDFVFHQYVRKYSSDNNFDIDFVDDIKLLSTKSLFSVVSNVVKIFETDTLEEFYYPSDEHVLWIKCKKISKKLKNKIDDDIIVECPKLEDWMIKDYVYTICKGIRHEELDEIIKAHNNDIYEIETELKKVSIFNNVENVFERIKPQLIGNVSTFGIFDLVNSLVKCDVNTINKILLEINFIDVDVFGLTALLINNFKKVIDVQLTKNPSAESLGMSGKQFWAIQKYCCNIYNKNQLIEIYKFLLSVDGKIKSGYIDSNMCVDYIINKILTIKEMV